MQNKAIDKVFKEPEPTGKSTTEDEKPAKKDADEDEAAGGGAHPHVVLYGSNEPSPRGTEPRVQWRRVRRIRPT